MKDENVWDAFIDVPRERDDLKARSDLLILIERRLKALEGDKAERLGINENQLEDLVLGKIDKFGMTHLESIARRAGIRR